jgi:hypothetical protein
MGTCTAAAAIFSLFLIWLMTRHGFAPGLYNDGEEDQRLSYEIIHLSILLIKDIRGTLYRRICLSTVIV